MSMLEAPAADVEAYAAAVRRALADLTPEQVDDLTDDLEVALADALADDHRATTGAGLVGLFGTPEAYAAELRTAAGLATGTPRKRGGSVGDVAARFRTSLLDGLEPLRAQPWWPGLAAFARSLAPLWWVARGWVCYAICGAVLGLGIPPRGLFAWVVLLAFVVVSAQWGRGLWLSHPLLRVARWTASVVAIVVAIPLLATYGGPQVSGSSYTVYPSTGVWVDERAAENLFVYDSSGQPVPGAQVFDDRGQPVLVDEGGYGAGWSDENGNWVDAAPAVSADGRPHWNAYPLRGAAAGDPDAPADDPASVAEPAWPFAQAGAVLLPSDLTTREPAPSASPAASSPAVSAPASPEPSPAD